MSHRVWHVFLAAALLAAAVLPLAGCGNDEDLKNRLGSALIALIDAEKRGEAESFAKSRLLDLVDGSVRVSIECFSGQLEAAVKAAARVGTVEIVNERGNSLQALIPITSLAALAREKSIGYIRPPIRGKTADG